MKLRLISIPTEIFLSSFTKQNARTCPLVSTAIWNGHTSVSWAICPVHDCCFYGGKSPSGKPTFDPAYTLLASVRRCVDGWSWWSRAQLIERRSASWKRTSYSNRSFFKERVLLWNRSRFSIRRIRAHQEDFSSTRNIYSYTNGKKFIEQSVQWSSVLLFHSILCLNKRLSKQWWGWWFETPPYPLWRHCNATKHVLHWCPQPPWSNYPRLDSLEQFGHNGRRTIQVSDLDWHLIPDMSY